jgi:hypothetical protein
LAGRRERSVLEERQDYAKVIHSKALLLAETLPPAAEAGPSPQDKAAFIVPEAVLPTDDNNYNNFQVTFSFGLWCYYTDSSCGLYRISKPHTSNHGKGEAVANSSSGPPCPGCHISACHQSYIETGEGQETVIYPAGFGQRNEEICTFITVLLNCE